MKVFKTYNFKMKPYDRDINAAINIRDLALEKCPSQVEGSTDAQHLDEVFNSKG